MVAGIRIGQVGSSGVTASSSETETGQTLRESEVGWELPYE